MPSLSIAIVGAGPVGTALGIFLQKKGHTIRSVISRRVSSARKLARLVGAGSWGSDPASLRGPFDLVLLAVPDPALQMVARSFVVRTLGPKVVLHTSGSQTSDVLRPLKGKGRLIGSFHPITSFPRTLRPDDAMALLDGSCFGIEGAPRARSWMKSFASELGCRTYSIPKERKTLYHVACTFASNYPLTLLEVVAMLAKRSGLPGLEPFERLVQSTIASALRSAPMKVLTGPVVRADGAALARHARALRTTGGEVSSLFYELVHLTSLQALRAGRITARDVRAIAEDIRTPWKG